jgi:UDP-glucuronate decarboxylase
MTNRVLAEDLNHIYSNLKDKEKEKLSDSVILITGCAGFLGYYFMNFLCRFREELKIKSVIGLDNFKLGKPDWIASLQSEHKDTMELHVFDIANDAIEKIDGVEEANLVVHMASIASPTFYRLHPVETIDANVWGLRRLLEFYKDKNIRGFLFFSSSEVYGDPAEGSIPTPEDYRGNVSCIGPRACYDESKRFGETLCYVFSLKFDIPVAVARPFNNYGPGMKLDDKRVPADFAEAILENKDIVILSDGTPTRTFCYVADAIPGYLKVLLFGRFEVFNIGIDKPEITVRELANIYVEKGRKIAGYTGSVRFEEPKEKEYLTHSPARRCPDISKAKRLLDYSPTYAVEQGVARFLEFHVLNRRGL